MRASTAYKKPRKAVVQLTSLLDLLFVMIFVSMIQQKQVVKNEEVKKGKLTKVKVEPKVKPIIKKETTPKPVVTNFSINAIFMFYASSQNPGIPSGSYKMRGQYDDKSGRLSLGGFSWVNRPKDYDMVPLSGIYNPKSDTFSGKVESPFCKTFTLRRDIKGTNSPVSGVWKGSYDCGQGATGLTLTVD